jgi:dihydrofolate synthase/folylpolyglutamate synthase
MPLPGRHQVTNAATAIALAESLRERGFDITRRAIIEGLETTRHEGRLEVRIGRPYMLFDGAHNAAGARALRDYLDEFLPTFRITLLFGAMRDKALDEMAATLFPVASLLYLTRLPTPRTATLGMLKKLAAAHRDKDKSVAAFFDSPAKALRVAEGCTQRDEILCVTGSLYLVGEVKNILERRERRIYGR